MHTFALAHCLANRHQSTHPLLCSYRRESVPRSSNTAFATVDLTAGNHSLKYVATDSLGATSFALEVIAISV